MHVIHLADYGGPYPGSFIPLLRAVGVAAERRGWSFELIFTPLARGREWLRLVEDFPVSFMEPKDLDSFVLPPRRLPTVLHSHFSGFDIACAAAARRVPSVTAFVHSHTTPSSALRSQVRNRVRYGLMLHGIAANFCVSPAVEHEIRRRFGRRTQVMPNAVDVSRFPIPTVEQRRLAREQLGLPESVPVLLHFGRDWEVKGGALMLHTLDLLPDAHCLTVGTDAARLEGFDGRSRLTVVPQTDDVWTLYAAADVLLGSSSAEGMPFAVLEALATGLPAALTPIDGHRMLADQAAGCFVAEAHDGPRLAETVMRAMAHAPPREEVRSWVASKMGVELWAENLLDIYGRNWASL
ncbi:glycosyltransferase family 4 protein [Nocardioides marmoribigeumensis]|uniref:Glycosyltransferase involved in cell wall biosynthesis n=1 Tax=Nocardioides marmoribigeumensis TaxID=433649 RepID=A0ABU2BTM9_9ACTN|nr:glycosyltransferase family 4 protein [Nocardioides marmoribigeumensis]MDR7361987.1 glycosyltransferase involved in cell wall biosynthesis [Nocardioides marmoribigeumensis]